MKRIKCASVLAFLLSCAVSQAQMPGANAPTPAMNRALFKLFGKNTAWTAQSEKVVTTAQFGTMTIISSTALLDEKLRDDMDMSQLKSSALPPGYGEQLKKAGVDHTITLVRTDKKTVYVLSPGTKSYFEVPFEKGKEGEKDAEPKMEKTSMGSETVEGHACAKNKIVVTDEKDEKHNLTVWTANDLKDFPIKISIEENGTTIVSQYKDIRFSKPDPKLFEIPAGYTKYNTAQEFQMAMMQKLMAGGNFGQPPAEESKTPKK